MQRKIDAVRVQFSVQERLEFQSFKGLFRGVQRCFGFAKGLLPVRLIGLLGRKPDEQFDILNRFLDVPAWSKNRSMLIGLVYDSFCLVGLVPEAGRCGLLL